MPSVTIADDLFERLVKRATALDLTVEQLIDPLLRRAVADEDTAVPAASAGGSDDVWNEQFCAWMAEVQARADRYPKGFVMDDRRESMY